MSLLKTFDKLELFLKLPLDTGPIFSKIIQIEIKSFHFLRLDLVEIVLSDLFVHIEHLVETLSFVRT